MALGLVALHACASILAVQAAQVTAREVKFPRVIEFRLPPSPFPIREFEFRTFVRGHAADVPSCETGILQDGNPMILQVQPSS